MRYIAYHSLDALVSLLPAEIATVAARISFGSFGGRFAVESARVTFSGCCIGLWTSETAY